MIVRIAGLNHTMNSNDAIYIGIDPTSGKKDFIYAALDMNLNLVVLAEADMEEILEFIGGSGITVIAVNAPARVNQGLVKKKLTDERSGRRRSVRGTDIRLAEYELRERGISVAGTPSREEYSPAWMQLGFNLYQRLSQIGYNSFATDRTGGLLLETHPFACFCTLAESIPFPKPTLEGRLQRQLILYDKGLRITDGMKFFEEITRFKLIRGILPQDVLYAPEQLDVLVAAYTAWLAANRPEEITKVGDKDEGQITLPATKLKESY